MPLKFLFAFNQGTLGDVQQAENQTTEYPEISENLATSNLFLESVPSPGIN